MLDIQNHRPLRELVYEELKNRILTGDIPPGTRLMEVDLAEDLGVSRTPVREAIRKLEKENLVTIEPRKGAYASKLEIKDLSLKQHHPCGRYAWSTEYQVPR